MRDPERQNRFNNTFTISYPDFPSIQTQARSVTLIQEMGKHDIVKIYYPKFNSSIVKAVKTGVPVQITWKNDKASGNFFGYTSDTSYPVIQQLRRGLTVTCVGASYPLKKRKPKIWKNKTASEIVSDICKEVKLKPFITPSSIRFTQQSIAGQSYWEKLNELAVKIGYGMQVIGTELHFHPIDKMINQFMTVIPTLAFKDYYANPISSFVSPTLDYFEPKLGDFIEGKEYSRTSPVVGGVDPLTAKSYIASSSSSKVGKNLRTNVKDPLFDSIETTTVIASSAMAKSLAEGRAQLGRFSIPATGIAQGDPRVAPWRTVEVRGTGDSTDGFWIIKRVEHVIHGDGRYQMEFDCLSDGSGSTKSTSFRPSSAGSVPLRNIEGELSTTYTKKPTSTKLSAPQPLVNQTSAGYKVTPRNWRGD